MRLARNVARARVAEQRPSSSRTAFSSSLAEGPRAERNSLPSEFSGLSQSCILVLSPFPFSFSLSSSHLIHFGNRVIVWVIIDKHETRGSAISWAAQMARCLSQKRSFPLPGRHRFAFLHVSGAYPPRGFVPAALSPPDENTFSSSFPLSLFFLLLYYYYLKVGRSSSLFPLSFSLFFSRSLALFRRASSRVRAFVPTRVQIGRAHV